MALYIKNELHSVECEELNSKHCETLWIKLYVNPTDYIVIGVCYRSPEADDNEVSKLFECIKSTCDHSRSVLNFLLWETSITLI